MNLANIKLPIAVIGIIIAQAFGIIWYVAQLDSTVNNNTTAIENVEEFNAIELWEAIEDVSTTITELENKTMPFLYQLEKEQVVVENEMRTIMSDHSGFNDILKELGKEGYGDNREYGNYGQ